MRVSELDKAYSHAAALRRQVHHATPVLVLHAQVRARLDQLMHQLQRNSVFF